MEKTLTRASGAFLAIFFLSIPLSSHASKYRSVISDSSFFQALNSIFVADYGVVWVSAVFWGLTICEGVSPHKAEARYIANRSVKYMLYLLFAVFFNAWFFGPSLVERLNVATGGHCGDPEVVAQSMTECRKNPSSSWVDGFDLSGHYYFLITSSLLLIDAMSQRDISVGSATLDRTQNLELLSFRQKLRMGTRLMRRFATFLIAICVAEFCVTSIFFHTVWEKASGLLGIPISFAILGLTDKFYPAQMDPEQVSAV